MNKAILLSALDSLEQADAVDIAEILQRDYPSTAMGLLRLVRQDLASRYLNPDTQLYVYEITLKGEARLDFFEEGELDVD